MPQRWTIPIGFLLSALLLSAPMVTENWGSLAVFGLVLFWTLVDRCKSLKGKFAGSFFVQAIMGLICSGWLPFAFSQHSGTADIWGYSIFLLYLLVAVANLPLTALLIHLTRGSAGSFGRNLVTLPIVTLALDILVPRLFPALFGFAILSSPLSVKQVASFIGVGGLGIFTVFLAATLRISIQRIGTLRQRVILVILALAIFGSLELYFQLRPTSHRSSNEVVTLHGIQLQQHDLDSYINYSHDILSKASRDMILVWPENAIEGPLNGEFSRPEYTTKFYGFLKDIPGHFLSGAILAEGDADNARISAGVLYFSGGREADRYFKRHLIPFGEWVPVVSKFESIYQRLPMGIRGYPGKDLNLFSIGNLKFGNQLCYEVVYSDGFAGLARAGADFILLAGSEVWTDSSIMKSQSILYAKARAIESGLTIFKLTAGGHSGVLTPDGRFVEVAGPEYQGPVILAAAIAKPNALTFYSRFENLTSWLHRRGSDSQ